MDFIESIPSIERVILVGHSLGGLSISQAMELSPQKVSLGVFVTAVMPGPSLPYSVISQKVIHTPYTRHPPLSKKKPWLVK